MAQDLEVDRMVDVLRLEVSVQAGEIVMSTADKLREEGRSEGRVQGIVEGKIEGRLEGRASALSELLEERFGPLPADAIKRLENASIEELQRWGRKLLVADSVEQVFLD